MTIITLTMSVAAVQLGTALAQARKEVKFVRVIAIKQWLSSRGEGRLNGRMIQCRRKGPRRVSSGHWGGLRAGLFRNRRFCWGHCRGVDTGIGSKRSRFRRGLKRGIIKHPSCQYLKSFERVGKYARFVDHLCAGKPTHSTNAVLFEHRDRVLNLLCEC